MANRMSSWLHAEAKRFPTRDVWTFRLSPGQYAELESETCKGVNTFQTERGLHPVECIELETRPTGDNVILMGRDDLFYSEGSAVQVFHANSVTSIPDNIGCCEVIAVGDLVTNVKPGDVCYNDFFEVKQPYIVHSDELYIAGSDAFRAKFDPVTGLVEPLENMVITRPAPDRFKVAMTGTDRVHMLPSQLSSGIAGGKTSDGRTSSHILYHEVVAVGPLTNRPRPGVMTKAERELLRLITRSPASEWDSLDEEEAEAINRVREERKGRPADIKPGDLCVFCEELGTKIRVRGDHQYMVPYDNVLAKIDDAAILDKAVRKGRAGKLTRVA